MGTDSAPEALAEAEDAFEITDAFETTDAFWAARSMLSSRLRRLTCTHARTVSYRVSELLEEGSNIQLPLVPSPVANADQRR